MEITSSGCPSFAKRKIWINPEKDFTTPKVEIYGKGDFLHTVFLSKDFKLLNTELGSIWYPFAGEEIFYGKEDGGEITPEKIIAIKVQSANLNVRVSDDLFTLEFPSGYTVIDSILDPALTYGID